MDTGTHTACRLRHFNRKSLNFVLNLRPLRVGWWCSFAGGRTNRANPSGGEESPHRLHH